MPGIGVLRDACVRTDSPRGSDDRVAPGRPRRRSQPHHGLRRGERLDVRQRSVGCQLGDPGCRQCVSGRSGRAAVCRDVHGEQLHPHQQGHHATRRRTDSNGPSEDQWRDSGRRSRRDRQSADRGRRAQSVAETERRHVAGSRRQRCQRGDLGRGRQRRRLCRGPVRAGRCQRVQRRHVDQPAASQRRAHERHNLGVRPRRVHAPQPHRLEHRRSVSELADLVQPFRPSHQRGQAHRVGERQCDHLHDATAHRLPHGEGIAGDALSGRPRPERRRRELEDDSRQRRHHALRGRRLLLGQERGDHGLGGRGCRDQQCVRRRGPGFLHPRRGLLDTGRRRVRDQLRERELRDADRKQYRDESEQGHGRAIGRRRLRRRPTTTWTMGSFSTT